jgi:hypothetical protein
LLAATAARIEPTSDVRSALDCLDQPTIDALKAKDGPVVYRDFVTTTRHTMAEIDKQLAQRRRKVITAVVLGDLPIGCLVCGVPVLIVPTFMILAVVAPMIGVTFPQDWRGWGIASLAVLLGLFIPGVKSRLSKFGIEKGELERQLVSLREADEHRHDVASAIKRASAYLKAIGKSESDQARLSLRISRPMLQPTMAGARVASVRRADQSPAAPAV